MTTTIVTRIGKGSALTWLEADTNFTNLKATADLALELATTTFTSGSVGVAPASGGGTSNYLRADGTWAAPPGTAGSVAVKDEGTTLTTGVTSIDFVGGGVSATNSGNAVTVTIPSGGSSFDFMGDATLYGPWRIAASSNTNGQFQGTGVTFSGTGISSGSAPSNTNLWTSYRKYHSDNMASGNYFITGHESTGATTDYNDYYKFKPMVASFLFGFGDSPLGAYYSTNQGMFVGFSQTISTSALTAGISFLSATQLSSAMGIGWDNGSSTLNAITKIGTGTVTTYTISGVTRATDHLYRAYFYKDVGEVDLTCAVQRLSNTTGLVLESGSTSIPYSELPTAILRPYVVAANGTTAENNMTSIAFISFVSRGQ